MELFKQTNFDFLRYKWPFIYRFAGSERAGLIQSRRQRRAALGIEFKGGMLMTAKFTSDKPRPNRSRSVSADSKALPSPPSVQTFENGSNEIEIGTEGADDATLAKNRQIVSIRWRSHFGQPGNGKLDLNNASDRANWPDRLRDPLQKAGVQLSDDQVNQSASAAIWLTAISTAGCLQN
jgi:preprotein translocase subunit SecD